MRSIVTALKEGQTVADAVWSSLMAFKFELDHVQHGLVVMGLPHLTASVSAGGKGGAKGGAKPGKK